MEVARRNEQLYNANSTPIKMEQLFRDAYRDEARGRHRTSNRIKCHVH